MSLTTKSTLKFVYRLLPALLALLLGGRAWAFDEDHKEAVNGTTLHFRVRGADKANPYLLILHGGPGFSAHMFYPWGTSLEKSLNLVYLDQRGCGESARYRLKEPFAPQPEELKAFTLDTLVQDIEGVREALKVPKWYVLGHSWGGMLGLEYTAKHPDQVLGLIDMDGAVSFPRMQNDMLANCEAHFQEQVIHGTEAQKKQAGNFLKQIQSLKALPPTNPIRLFGAFQLALGSAGLYFAGDTQTLFGQFQSRIRDSVQPYKIPTFSLAQASEPMQGLIEHDHLLTRDDTPLLGKIRVPALLLNGKQDGVITPDQAQMAHRGIRNSQLLVLDACGHFPFVEQPEKTTAAVLDFVSRQGKKGS